MAGRTRRATEADGGEGGMGLSLESKDIKSLDEQSGKAALAENNEDKRRKDHRQDCSRAGMNKQSDNRADWIGAQRNEPGNKICKRFEKRFNSGGEHHPSSPRPAGGQT